MREMAREGESTDASGRQVRHMEEGAAAANGREESVTPDHGYGSSANGGCGLNLSVPFLQKVTLSPSLSPSSPIYVLDVLGQDFFKKDHTYI